jgi:hypothetical protein
MSNITILVGKDGRPSMKKVYAQMKSGGQLLVKRAPKAGSSYIRSYGNGNIEKFKKLSLNELTLEDRKVIRWGNRIEAPTSKATIVYNKAESIANATDKKLSRELFIKGKVRTPKLVTPTNVNNEDFPIIARPSRHAKGKNFLVFRALQEFVEHWNTNEANGWYYSAFIDKEREFRVHCAHGKVLAIMEKARGGDKIAWNRAVTGEPFTKIQQKDFIYSVCFQALKAIKTLGLDFGGVDVLLLGKEAFVLEVNTSPTLNSSDWVSEQYAKYFDWLNRSDKRRDHWDFTRFENPLSFAWKQFQLLEVPNTKPVASEEATIPS